MLRHLASPHDVQLVNSGTTAIRLRPKFFYGHAGQRVVTGQRCFELVATNQLFGSGHGMEPVRYHKLSIRPFFLLAGMLPQVSVLPEYALTRPEKCDTCAKHVDCQKTYEEDARKAICSYLKWREYDELYELRNEIDKILLEQVLIGKDISLKEAKRALEERQRKINTNIQRRFPKIKRWTKLATILSTPATIVAAAGGNIPAAIVSASMTGAAQVTEKMLELYESKSKWVGFINKMSK